MIVHLLLNDRFLYFYEKSANQSLVIDEITNVGFEGPVVIIASIFSVSLSNPVSIFNTIFFCDSHLLLSSDIRIKLVEFRLDPQRCLVVRRDENLELKLQSWHIMVRFAFHLGSVESCTLVLL